MLPLFVWIHCVLNETDRCPIGTINQLEACILHKSHSVFYSEKSLNLVLSAIK